MTDAERDRFDAIFDRVLRELPLSVRELFDESPLIIEDRPNSDILQEFELDPEDETLCGLYTGIPLTERAHDNEPFPSDHIYIFREGIIQQAGGWQPSTNAHGEPCGGESAIANEIRITILHELGHHFGLDEDDLMQMGYD